MGVDGFSFSAMYIRGTPGNSVGFSFAIAFSTMSMSKRGISTSLAAFVIAKFIASVPNEWKKGRDASTRVLALVHHGEPDGGLARVRDEVAVAERGPLREPGGPARVDEGGRLGVGMLDVHLRWDRARVLHQVLPPAHPVPLGHERVRGAVLLRVGARLSGASHLSGGRMYVVIVARITSRTPAASRTCPKRAYV